MIEVVLANPSHEREYANSRPVCRADVTMWKMKKVSELSECAMQRPAISSHLMAQVPDKGEGEIVPVPITVSVHSTRAAWKGQR